MSKGDFEGFTPNNRIQLNTEDIQWDRLDELMTLGEDFYHENQRLRERSKQANVITAKRRRGNKLRDREPW